MWLQKIKQCETSYLQLFDSLQERSYFYTNNKDQRFTAHILFREGTLGVLLIYLDYLRVYIGQLLNCQDENLPSALALLKAVNPRLGHYYKQAFDKYATPEQRFTAATGSKRGTLSSQYALKASLGVVPEFEVIENQNQYGLPAAERELQAYVNYHIHFSKIVDQHGQPDERRQRIIATALAVTAHKELDLSYCVILDDTLLSTILSKSQGLVYLSLRHCPRITGKSIAYLATQHTCLQKLYLSDNLRLKYIAQKRWFFQTDEPLNFPSLEILKLSHCLHLKAVLLYAPKLNVLRITDCPSIQTVFNLAKKAEDVKGTVSPIIYDPIYEDRLVIISCGELMGYSKRECLVAFHNGTYCEISSRVGQSLVKHEFFFNEETVKAMFFDYGDYWHLPKVHRRHCTMFFVDISSPGEFKRKLEYYSKYCDPGMLIVIIGIPGDNIYGRYDLNTSQTPGRIEYQECLNLVQKKDAAAYFECSPHNQESLQATYYGVVVLTLMHYGIWDQVKFGDPQVYLQRNFGSGASDLLQTF